MSLQSTSTVLLVPPSNFGYSSETSQDNIFAKNSLYDMGLEEKVELEFTSLYDALKGEGINVLVFPSTSSSPDAIFANNWLVSTNHPTPRLSVMKMLHSSRKDEVRLVELEDTFAENDLEIPAFDHYENLLDDSCALEGTGSLVLDRINLVAYLTHSPRSNEKLAQIWTKNHGFELVTFQSSFLGKSIYHTNIMMTIGSNFAIICDEVIASSDRSKILERLGADRELILIGSSQMQSFCANSLELSGKNGPILAMSETARNAFTPKQIETLGNYTQILPIPFANIESASGGGVRCSICELFL